MKMLIFFVKNVDVFPSSLLYTTFVFCWYFFYVIYVHTCISHKDNNFDEGPQIITMIYNNNNNNNIQSNDTKSTDMLLM